jgi:hypothetical protein
VAGKGILKHMCKYHSVMGSLHNSKMEKSGVIKMKLEPFLCGFRKYTNSKHLKSTMINFQLDNSRIQMTYNTDFKSCVIELARYRSN